MSKGQRKGVSLKEFPQAKLWTIEASKGRVTVNGLESIFRHTH